MDNIISEDTVERVRKTDEKYFSFQHNGEQYLSHLYDQFSAALLGIIYQRVKNETNAEVILAAVFINAWKNRKFFNEKNERVFT
jgi:DNA-directed RNA polymerase specialized sigma24 family protein